MNPLNLLFLILVGLAQRDQQKVIDYLIAENRVLKQLHLRKRIRLNNNQRRRLAVKAKRLGYAALSKLPTLFTPDTILRWHRQLVARKFSHQPIHKGRPRIRKVIVDAILKFAIENPSWGYLRIQGALKNIGYPVSPTTIANVLKRHGIEPSPDRNRPIKWKTFLKAHWDVIAAIDFTTVEVWTARGLLTFYLLFAMDIKTRRVHLAGATVSPNGAWVKQMAKNMTNHFDGFLNEKRILIMDRDTKFSSSFRATLRDEQIESVRLPPYSPNLNAHMERFFRSLKSECLDLMIFFGEKSLRNAVTQYLEHYHHERNHQGLDNRLIDPTNAPDQTDETLPIQCRERLGGLLRHYHRTAA